MIRMDILSRNHERVNTFVDDKTIQYQMVYLSINMKAMNFHVL